jgi:DNA-directed RNA polymerase specialized sigma24 family protein
VTPTKVNYVDNIIFNEQMLIYIAKKKENPKERIPDSIGLIIMNIANNLAKLRRFNGYTYKEEFIGDAIETCIKYLDNFDPLKSNNPFGYFTQICYYAFVRRIKKEKQQHQIKRDIVSNLELLEDSELANFQEIDSQNGEFLVEVRSYLKSYNDSYETNFNHKELIDD